MFLQELVQHLADWLGKLKKKCIPYPTRVVNIKSCIQTGTALTEETEELSDRFMVRSCICNMQTKSLV